LKIVGNSRFQKAANSALILNYLRINRSCSRHQMAEDLGLQPSTVSYITGRLIKAGLVEEISEKAPQKKGSGRRPILVQLIKQYGYVIGLDLQVDYYCAVVCDITGTFIDSKKREYGRKKLDFQTLLVNTVSEVTRNLDPHIPVMGMGLALPGIIRSADNIVKDSWTHNLKDADFTEFLDESFPFPVIMENDANCCAQNILWNHPETHYDDSFVYLLSRFHKREHLPENLPSIGIGMGLVVNGKLYTGQTQEAGEYQSILFSRERQLKWQLSLSEKEMDRALYDPEIQIEIIRELMGNMMLILQILNPKALFIGGDLSGSGDLVHNVLTTDLFERWEILKNKGCQVEMRDQGGFDPAKGAAACMLNELYAIPQVGNNPENKKKWKTLLSNITEEIN